MATVTHQEYEVADHEGPSDAVGTAAHFLQFFTESASLEATDRPELPPVCLAVEFYCENVRSAHAQSLAPFVAKLM